MSDFSGVPGGDPGSASFPAQLDATVAAVERRLVNRWATLAARSAAYAAAGTTPVAGESFRITASPGVVFEATGTGLTDYVQISRGIEMSAGQAAITWAADSLTSPRVWVDFPAGRHTSRPIVQLTPIGASDAAQVTVALLVKDASDTPKSEVSTAGFGVQLFVVSGSPLSPGQVRYVHWTAREREPGDPCRT